METLGLRQGIHKFGEKGYRATCSEMLQIHQRICLKSIKVKIANIFSEKDKIIKSKTCTNGGLHRACMQKEDTSSPTDYLEIIMLILVIDTKEDRDVSTIYITNLIILTSIDRKPR